MGNSIITTSNGLQLPETGYDVTTQGQDWGSILNSNFGKIDQLVTNYKDTVQNHKHNGIVPNPNQVNPASEIDWSSYKLNRTNLPSEVVYTDSALDVSANKFTTGREITLKGDVSGQIDQDINNQRLFDGSQNINITTTIDKSSIFESPTFTGSVTVPNQTAPSSTGIPNSVTSGLSSLVASTDYVSKYIRSAIDFTTSQCNNFTLSKLVGATTLADNTPLSNITSGLVGNINTAIQSEVTNRNTAIDTATGLKAIPIVIAQTPKSVMDYLVNHELNTTDPHLAAQYAKKSDLIPLTSVVTSDVSPLFIETTVDRAPTKWVAHGSYKFAIVNVNCDSEGQDWANCHIKTNKYSNPALDVNRDLRFDVTIASSQRGNGNTVGSYSSNVSLVPMSKEDDNSIFWYWREDSGGTIYNIKVLGYLT